MELFTNIAASKWIVFENYENIRCKGQFSMSVIIVSSLRGKGKLLGKLSPDRTPKWSHANRLL